MKVWNIRRIRRLPGSDFIIGLIGGKIFAILCWGPWRRRKLMRRSLGVGSHSIDLNRLDIPEKRDLLLVLESKSEERLRGTIDFSLPEDDS